MFINYKREINALAHLHRSIASFKICLSLRRVIQTGAIRKLGTLFYSSSTVTMPLFCIISEMKQVENNDFFSYPVHPTAPLGGPRRNIDTVWHRKTNMVWLANGGKNSRI